MLSLVLTIHNQAALLPSVFTGIDKTSSLVEQFIVVFDGCTDSSEECFSNWYIPGMYRYDFKVIFADNVFETKANNLGLKEVTQPYVIILQDDCVVKEDDWDKRLLEPFLKFPDIFAVTGNTAHNVVLSNNIVDFPDVSNRSTGLNRNILSIRDVVNRGPLMLDYKIVKELNYFDEQFAPQACDDHDLCLRAYIERGLKCGAYWIDYESKPEWGSSRKGNNSWWYKAFEKNKKLLVSRYSDYLQLPKHNEERIV